VSRARGPHATGSPLFALALGLSFALVLVFLTLPVVAIFVRSPPSQLLARLGEPLAREALLLSIETTAIAMLVVVMLGTPAAYLLAMRSFRGSAALLTALELPLVLPPVVAGLGLLAALGPHGLLGSALATFHIRLVLQTAGVVVALAFVSFPFFLTAAHAAFSSVERSALEVARTLGAGERAVFLRIALPAARQGLLAGLALAWARALGEFGATLMFAGSFPGVTQTAPLAIYDRFAEDQPAALALAAVLVVVSGALLLTMRVVLRAPSGR
jgi:molybdate transport system permease protein